MKIRFSERLSATERQQIQDLIEKTTRKRAREGEEKYEFISRQAARISRLRLNDLTNEEAVALRFYGRYGRVVNTYTRLLLSYNPNIQEPPMHEAISRIEMLKRTFAITEPKHITEQQSDIADKIRYIFKKLDAFLAISFTSYIDRIIRTYSDRYEHGGYLYRIGETLKDEARPQSGQGPLSPGDIIVSSALWSTSIDSDAVLFRYAREGQGVTKMVQRVRSDTGTRERYIPQISREILYIIEDNDALERLDISGFKARTIQEGKSRDRFSSGEVLVRSRTPFRVIAIQEPQADLARQIVVLRPVPLQSVDLARDPIKDPYNLISVAPILKTRLVREAQEQAALHQRHDPPLVQKLAPVPSQKLVDPAEDPLLNPALNPALSLGELSEGDKQEKSKQKFKEDAEGEGEGLEELAELL